jgi:hypothetical protein
MAVDKEDCAMNSRLAASRNDPLSATTTAYFSF